MNSWRDRILSEFVPGASRLTLVADPDGLLLEERVLASIRELKFELIPFDDPIAFRYAYESQFRAHWDRGEQGNLVVVLHSSASDLGGLPYDLLQSARRLSFGLGELFPKLSHSIVALLEPVDLDALYDAQRRHAPGFLGDNATKEFVLRHVFGIAPELILDSADLLSVLLRRHFKGRRIPVELDERLIQLIRQRDEFADWPLEAILPDREAFFAFLQERWPRFLDSLANSHPSIRDEAFPALAYPGPLHLPFDHDDVRVYVDNLFLEGLLQTVPHSRSESLSTTWMAVGIRADELEDRMRRMDRLIDAMALTIPTEDARHDDWFRFARTWAELNALRLKSILQTPGADTRNTEPLQTQVDAAFALWVEKRYAGLANLPPTPPVMLHHVPRMLARRVHGVEESKVALLVVDGLSFDQWIVTRQELIKRCPGYQFREHAVFAWIPTITSVSRQAAFAGRPPFYFPRSIHTTEKEPALWKRFWGDQGVPQQQVVYAKSLGDGELDGVAELIAGHGVRVAGLVIDKVDKIMHGMELGAAGMHNQVQQWAAQPYLSNLLGLLLEKGFRVYLTSDHGNIEASGCGRPAEGAVADLRGERVRVYRDESLRRHVSERFPDAHEWPKIGLPEDYLPLLAPGRLAFIRENDRIVGHGGACIEELIVPLVQIERRTV